MTKPQTDGTVRPNQLPGALEPATRKRIDPNLEVTPFRLGEMVRKGGGILQHACFPEGSVLSLLTVLKNGNAIDTANIGREGTFGLFAAMYSRVSFSRCIVQLVGPAVWRRIEVQQYEFRRSEHVRDLLVGYSETLLSQVRQTVACNALRRSPCRAEQ